MRPAERLGSWCRPGGASFRVWAPNATAVSVNLRTSFNSVAMAGLPGGYWHADVPGAGPGEHYQYSIRTADALLSPRVDPYAREINGPHGDRQAVVYDEAAFDWGTSDHLPPSLSELVIYEMHVGTFNELPSQQV